MSMMAWQNQVKQSDEMEVPDLFRCPITLDILVDPVTLSTGQTYERSSIQKWLGDGNRTCPVTMQELQDLSLVPNHTLCHLIHQYCPPSVPSPPPRKLEPPQHESSMATLKETLQSPYSTLEVRLEAVKKVRALSEGADYSKKEHLFHLGFHKLLLDILLNKHLEEDQSPTTKTVSPRKWELVEEALQCVVNLSPCSKVGSLLVLKEEAELSSLCRLFEQGSIRIITILCCLIHSISSDMEYFQQPALQLGQTPSILQKIVSLLEQSSDPDASDAAVTALSSLCRLAANQESVIKEGGIHGLITYISATEKRLVSKALATLETLLRLDSGKKSLMSNPKAVRALVKMVFRVSYDDEGSESAVSSLLMMCCGSLVLRKEAVSAGAVTQLLLLLQSQCSGRAKCKARKLLRVLRTLWTEHPRFFDVVWFR